MYININILTFLMVSIGHRLCLCVCSDDVTSVLILFNTAKMLIIINDSQLFTQHKNTKTRVF